MTSTDLKKLKALAERQDPCEHIFNSQVVLDLIERIESDDDALKQMWDRNGELSHRLVHLEKVINDATGLIDNAVQVLQGDIPIV